MPNQLAKVRRSFKPRDDKSDKSDEMGRRWVFLSAWRDGARQPGNTKAAQSETGQDVCMFPGDGGKQTTPWLQISGPMAARVWTPGRLNVEQRAAEMFVWCSVGAVGCTAYQLRAGLDADGRGRDILCSERFVSE